MTQFEKSISNKSYTNKDFGTIYPELLDLAKKLSYKWDPTVSDESDPGVVLIKLAAILADKLNYNIDKNVLELYPISVTQLANARKIFLDNGYKMKYFQSAIAPLTLCLIKEPEIGDADVAKLITSESGVSAETVLTSPNYPRTYVVPKYTMFTDTNTSVVYTLIEDVYLTSNLTSATGNAIQGKVVELNVGGSTTITADHLRDSLIIKLPDTQVAENGVFITSVDSGETWECVDNILLQPPETRCYEFNISPDGNTCYVEFPDDVLQLIGGGINIHYIVTSGYNGNVSNNFINKFFTDTSIDRYIEPQNVQSVNVTSTNISVSNKSRTLSGLDPESIESAYRNYKRTRNTFQTLVSTQDYSNFIYTNKDASNGFVCDRNDDIQSSIKLVKMYGDHESTDIQTRTTDTMKEYTGKIINSDGVVTTESATIQVVEQTPEMTAFDLRVYGLQYVEAPSSSAEQFSKSFQPLLYTADEKSKEWKILEEDMRELKCISHNFVEFVPNRVFMIKNRFPIVAKLVSSSKLTITQQDEILRKAQKALYDLLNARVIDFGSEIDYTEVYDALTKCDSRVNAIMLNEFRYETYAVYVDSSGKVNELRIDAASTAPTDSALFELWNDFRAEIFTRSMLAGTTQPLVKDTVFTYQINQHPVEFSKTSSSTSSNSSGENGDPDGEDTPGGSDPDDETPGGSTPGGSDPDDETPGGEDDTPDDTPESGDENDPGEDDIDPEAEENPDNTPTTPEESIVEVSVIEGEAVLPLKYEEQMGASGSVSKNWWMSTPIEENSTVVLTAPNLISGSPFTTYVKFIHNIGLSRYENDEASRPIRSNLDEGGDITPQIVVNANEDYVLEMGEYIIFFWKDEDSDSAPYRYKKFVGTADVPTIICPTRALYHQPDPAPHARIEENLQCVINESADKEGSVPDDTNGANKYIASYLYGEAYDIKTDSISPKTINRIQINDSKNDNGCLYWILKSSLKDEKTGSLVYRLFDKGETRYTLQNGETVIYTNNSGTELYLLGGGTVLERVATSNAEDLVAWDCPVITATPVEYLAQGPTFFTNPSHEWFKVNSTKFEVWATEMEYYILNQSHKIKLTPYNSLITPAASKVEYEITGSGIVQLNDSTAQLDLQSYDVSYIDAGGNEVKLSGKHHSKIKWEIYSQLSIRISKEKELVLHEGETLTGYTPVENLPVDDTTELENEDIIIVGGVPVVVKPSWILVGSATNPVHIQSDVDIDITSNKKVNVEYVDIFTGERKQPSFFVYTVTTTSTETIEVGDEFKKVICTPGSYILPVSLVDTTVNKAPVVKFTPYRNISTGALTTAELADVIQLQSGDIPSHLHPSFATVVERALNKAHVSLNNVIPQTHIGNSLRLISTSNEDGTWRLDPTRKTCKYLVKYFGTNCVDIDSNYGGEKISTLEDVENLLEKCHNGDVSFILTDVGTYVAVHHPDGFDTPYTLFSIDNSVSALKTTHLPTKNAGDDQVISDVAGFTLRFADKTYEGNNTPTRCRTLLQYSTESNTSDVVVKSGRYYFCVDIPEGTVYYDLMIGSLESDNELSSLRVSNLYKYSYASLSPTSDLKFELSDKVKELLRRFDKEGYFNYVRTPDVAREVQYPLDSIAFCDENHILNKCTICQYTPKSSRVNDIQVITKLK